MAKVRVHKAKPRSPSESSAHSSDSSSSTGGSPQSASLRSRSSSCNSSVHTSDLLESGSGDDKPAPVPVPAPPTPAPPTPAPPTPTVRLVRASRRAGIRGERPGTPFGHLWDLYPRDDTFTSYTMVCKHTDHPAETGCPSTRCSKSLTDARPGVARRMVKWWALNGIQGSVSPSSAHSYSIPIF